MPDDKSTVRPGFNGNFGFSSGTSMSSPHIAGTAAALLGLFPGWRPADVKSAIVNTADATAVTDHATVPRTRVC
jgi:subtilisin family serine protease